jgi:hypothetical protein
MVVLVWTSGPLRTSVASFFGPLHQRAAFTWEERFEDGLTHWVHGSALSPDGSGAVRVQGLAIHGRTLPLRNYEMSFEARIQKTSIGWVVRASGRDEFYTFKLADRGKTVGGRKLELTRPNQQVVPVVIPVPEGDFLDISVRVTEDQIVTAVNGYGVDAWKHPKFRSSSVGLLAEKGESFLVRSLTISGNEDFLGLFLRNLMSLAAVKVG